MLEKKCFRSFSHIIRNLENLEKLPFIKPPIILITGANVLLKRIVQKYKTKITY